MTHFDISFFAQDDITIIEGNVISHGAIK